MLAAVSRLIATLHTHHPAGQGPDDRTLPPKLSRSSGSWTTAFGLFATAGVWVLLTEFGETLTAQACYRHSMMPEGPQWLMPILNAASLLALLIGLAGTGVAWRHWRLIRDEPSASAPPVLARSIGRRRYVAMAALLLSLLFLVGLVATGLAVFIVSPCSAWR